MNTTISADGSAIAYDRYGSGPTLILVGGAYQYRAFDPRTGAMAQLLSSDFTVYHYDRRGRGGSSDALRYTGASGDPATAVRHEVDDIAALIEQAGGGQALLYGMSSGGILALEAVAAGLPIAKLAVYEVPLIVAGNRPPVPENYRAELANLVGAGRRGDAASLFFTRSVGVPDDIVAQMRDSPMWSAFEEVAHTLPYDGALMDVGGTLPARWSSLKTPTLVADGDAGMPWMRPAADALAAALPNARRVTLAGQDHGVEPEAISPVIRDFFLE
jgi:pimeloyl-ACP methyl ester carboxylesterase